MSSRIEVVGNLRQHLCQANAPVAKFTGLHFVENIVRISSFRYVTAYTYSDAVWFYVHRSDFMIPSPTLRVCTSYDRAHRYFNRLARKAGLL